MTLIFKYTLHSYCPQHPIVGCHGDKYPHPWTFNSDPCIMSACLIPMIHNILINNAFLQVQGELLSRFYQIFPLFIYIGCKRTDHMIILRVKRIDNGSDSLGRTEVLIWYQNNSMSYYTNKTCFITCSDVWKRKKMRLKPSKSLQKEFPQC